jgi:phage terminase large subunit-like protein
VKQCLDSGKLAKVGADPAGIGTLVDELAKIGVTTKENGTGMLVGVRQGVALMGAIKTMERKLIDGSFKHGGRRMMAWCAGNAVSEQTGTGMRIARDACRNDSVSSVPSTIKTSLDRSLKTTLQSKRPRSLRPC